MNFLFKLSRPYKRVISVLFDISFIIPAFLIAHAFRFETFYLWGKITSWDTLYLVICSSVLVF
jgi:hypothetical protein